MDLPDLGGLSDFQLAKLGVNTPQLDSLLSAVQDSLDAGHLGPVHFATNATFCIASTGEILATHLSSLLTLERETNNSQSNSSQSNGSNNHSSIQRMVLWRNVEHTNATFKKNMTLNPEVFNAAHGAAGGRCLDLTSGLVGSSELQSLVNSPQRLARINAEANGHWKAKAYELWEDTTVEQTKRGLGTEMGPLKLPLRQHRSHSHAPDGVFLAKYAPDGVFLPSSFDARAHWPDCVSIGTIRNQGPCGSCWAFAAVTVLADRVCIANQASSDKVSLMEITVNSSTYYYSLQNLHLAPEHLITCDDSNAGCNGGRLDNVWWYLRDHGVPTESCKPYRYCPVPDQQKCGFDEGPQPDSPLVAAANPADTAGSMDGSSYAQCMASCEGIDKGAPMHLYQVSMAYAVSAPSDVAGLQRELLTHGPVEVGFFVFSDFHSYRHGVYFRTPGAFGPLGGHAVKLLGWGKAGRIRMEYWLAANSWSPAWGMDGFFKIRRGTNECGIESTPAAGLPMLGDSPARRRSL